MNLLTKAYSYIKDLPLKLIGIVVGLAMLVSFIFKKLTKKEINFDAIKKKEEDIYALKVSDLKEQLLPIKTHEDTIKELNRDININ